MAAIEIDRVTLRLKHAELVCSRGRAFCAFGMAGTVAAAAAAWNILPSALLLGWVAVQLVLHGLLYMMSGSYSRATSDAVGAGSWLRRYVTLLILIGIAWGALGGTAVVQDAPLSTTILLLFIIGAVAFATIPAFVGYLPATLGVVLSALLPPGLLLLLEQGNGERMAGALTCLWTVLLAGGAMKLRKVLRDLASAQHESAVHLAHLDTRREQIEKLTVALKTTQDKREQAELELRRISADLGLAKGKAKALSDTLERVSPYCPVTNLHNRRCFDETLRVEWRRFTREKKPISLILCQIDEIDAYRETYGEQMTETLLKRVAKVVRGFGRRAGDISARFADSRFALLLPGCDTKNAFAIAEAVRERIADLKLSHDKSRIGEFVTAHLGVATMVPTRNVQERTLVERVEAAAYEASFQGGNRTVLYRALDKLRLEHWNMKADGPLNEEALLQKIMIWGYEVHRRVHPAGTRIPDRNHETEVVQGVLSGQLKVTVEGQSLILKHGDCLVIPAGITYSREVVGEDPVISFDAATQK